MPMHVILTAMHIKQVYHENLVSQYYIVLSYIKKKIGTAQYSFAMFFHPYYNGALGFLSKQSNAY